MPLRTQINPDVKVDLSNLSYTGTLYLQAFTQGMVDLRSRKATYSSDEKQAITFRARLKSNAVLPNEITNRAYITTSTPEIDTDNNSGSYTLFTEATDLAVTKTVDLASAGVGDELTYTIAYENKGPQDATNVLIKDTLPQGASYLSSNTQLLGLLPFVNGYRRLEYTMENSANYPYGISFELMDGNNNILAQKTVDTHNVANTTYVFTGQLTTDGPVVLSRRSMYGYINGYGDGRYKLYLDGVLILE